MKTILMQIRSGSSSPGQAGRWVRGATGLRPGDRVDARGDGTVQPDARSGQPVGAASHPLAELLACPPETGNLLTAKAEGIEFDAGVTVFRQGEVSRGLYVVISGQLLRKTERLDARLTLGSVRGGELVELGAVLGDERHTYTLTAQSPGSLLLLPMGPLHQAFQSYPPLRMQLLEEFAREVSRGYLAGCATRLAGIRRRRPDGGMAERQ